MLVGALVFLLLPDGTEEGCDLGYRPSIEDASTDRTVVAVAEREVIAASPLPWGSSVAVVTRVWGDRKVERWHVSKRKSADCTFDTHRGVGSFSYDFEVRGGLTPPYLRYLESVEAVGAGETQVWSAEFGGVVTYEVGFPDRFFAWLRVFPELLAFLPVVGLVFWIRREERSDIGL